MTQDIFILGATGNVGKTLVSQIFEHGDNNPDKHVNPTRIMGMASIFGPDMTKGYIFSPEGLSKEQSLAFSNQETSEYKVFETLDDVLNEVKALNNLVFVDVTPDKKITDFHKKIIEETNHGIVTANKNPISLSDYNTFRSLTVDPTRYGYRCSVMAGAEAVSFLQDLNDVNDKPQIIQGCFSGTLGYITSELEKGVKFSDIVKKAKAEGYTEPHPRDDLNGLDVARKLLILARTGGYEVEMDDMEINPLMPEKYFAEDDIPKFLESTSEMDDYFAQKVKEADAKGNTLRYVAYMDATSGKPKLTVGLKEVPKNSALGSLKGTSNKIEVISRAYPDGSSYSVEAPGAGLEVTAQNVRRDLLYRLKDRKFLS